MKRKNAGILFEELIYASSSITTGGNANLYQELVYLTFVK